VTVHLDDPVGAELDTLLAQPEIRQRLEEFQRRFERGKTRTIPHEEVRRRLALEEPASEEPPSSAEG
jgi:hypothetical protein